MASVCADQHGFHNPYQLQLLNKKSSLAHIPPRKLLTRLPTDEFSAEALNQKLLPYNGDDDVEDPYSSDHFRMYEFKVRRCTRSRSHDWTDCPFAHPGEKARRRDPRRHHYSGDVCQEFRRGSCSRGESCEFAHGVFECWLHPARYRTEACKDGKNCKRKVCFFAHSPRQLRVLPPPETTSSTPATSRKPSPEKKKCHCCRLCRPVAASPTSTLIGASHLSPPLSPDSMSWVSPLVSALESMNMNEASNMGTNGRNFLWVDLDVFSNGNDRQQFVLSPSTPSSSGLRDFYSGAEFTKKSSVEDKFIEGGLACPDLGWVNDLLT
ncbi:hypothetical protein NMG60_11002973 [Bertholletia excelsa]